MQTRQHVTANVVKPELFVDVSYWVWRLSNDCHPTSSVLVMRHSPERLHQCPNNYSVYFFQTHNVFGKNLKHWIKSLFLSPACKMYDNKKILSSYRNKHFFCQVNHTHWLLFLYVCFSFALFILSQSHFHRAVAYWKQHKSNNAVFQGNFLYNYLALDVKMHPINH